ncbi:hypothetical protein [Desulforhopalus sp. 52FAK]
MQVDRDDSDQNIVVVELKTFHLLSATQEAPALLVGKEIIHHQTFFYISINSPPDTPPPTRDIA